MILVTLTNASENPLVTSSGVLLSVSERGEYVTNLLYDYKNMSHPLIWDTCISFSQRKDLSPHARW